LTSQLKVFYLMQVGIESDPNIKIKNGLEYELNLSFKKMDKFTLKRLMSVMKSNQIKTNSHVNVACMKVED